MARIFQEGFECPIHNFVSHVNDANVFSKISSGRHIKSKGCAEAMVSGFDKFAGGYHYTFGVVTIPNALTEFYSRIWIYISPVNGTYGFNDNYIIAFRDDGNVNRIAIKWIYYAATSCTFALYVNSVLIGTFMIPYSTWTKLDFHLKSNATTGGYTLKVNDIVLYTATGINTGVNALNNLNIGLYDYTGSGLDRHSIRFDDIAVNDISGEVNNSWCGDGTMLALRPKDVGNKTQFDDSYGKYRISRTGTGPISIKIPTHGLSTDDYIKNTSRTNTYSAVTKVDNDTLTTASISGQIKGDVISLYKYSSNVSAIDGTNTTTIVTTDPHGLNVGDVIYNVTRGVFRYVTVLLSTTSVTISSAVTSQTSGDSINLYPIKTDHPHWSVLEYPSTSISDGYIQTDTHSDIDTFDMENLVADLSLPTSSIIVSVSENLQISEIGSGSQIKPVLRIDTTDYEGGTIDILPGTNGYSTIYDVSPATSSAFTVAEIDAIESGIKLV